MGTFLGHAVPGSFFALFALWHILQLSIRYFSSKRPGGAPFKSATYFTCGDRCGSVPWESILKVAATTTGILGETITGFDKHGNFVAWGNCQHIAMFSFFFFASVVEILHHYKYHLPPHSMFVAYIVSFIVEGILFYWHLHGRSMMDIQIHTLLLYVILGTVACFMLEMLYRHAVLPALARAYLMLLQGFWFWQAGFILYPPFDNMSKWDQTNHEQMTLVTVTFCLHAGLCLLIGGSIWFLVSCRFGMCKKPAKDVEIPYSSLAMKVLEGRNERVKVGGHYFEDNSDDEELFSK